MKALLIGERSAGMTAVEIYNDDEALVWSYRWFEYGASESEYRDGLADAFDSMRLCADVADFDGSSTDDNGDPIVFNDSATSGVMLEYSTQDGWRVGDDARRLGQGREIVDACMAVGLVEPDEDHDADGSTVEWLIAYITPLVREDEHNLMIDLLQTLGMPLPPVSRVLQRHEPA